eukprot:8142423-Pyramimonas_sp.AAC.1
MDERMVFGKSVDAREFHQPEVSDAQPKQFEAIVPWNFEWASSQNIHILNKAVGSSGQHGAMLNLMS